MWNDLLGRVVFFLLLKFSGLKIGRVVALRGGSAVDKLGIRKLRHLMGLNDFTGLGESFARLSWRLIGSVNGKLGVAS